MKELNDFTQLFLWALNKDARNDKIYGFVDGNETYVFDVATWVRYCETTGDLPFLQALLVAQEGLQRRRQAPALLRALQSFSTPLFASLASVQPSDVYASPASGMVSMLADLEGPHGLTPTYCTYLKTLSKSLCALWHNEPKFQHAFRAALDEACVQVRLSESGSYSALLMQALTKHAVPLKYQAAKEQQFEPLSLTWPYEFLSILAGERAGTWTVAGYVVIDLDVFVEGLLTSPVIGPYAPLQLITDAASGDGAARRALPTLVTASLARELKPVRVPTQEKVLRQLGRAVAHPLVVSRVSLLERLPAGEAPPDRRGIAVREPKAEAGSRDPSRVVDGLRLVFRKNMLMVDPASVCARFAAGAEKYAYATHRATVAGTTFYAVNAFIRFAEATYDEEAKRETKELREHLYRLQFTIGDDRKKFDGYCRQRAALAARASGERKTRLHLTFTAEQDELIYALWRPGRTPVDAKERLEAAMPEHKWFRIGARGKLLAHLHRKGVPVALAQQPDFEARLSAREREEFALALGGAARIGDV
jgi:hypothetical protein